MTFFEAVAIRDKLKQRSDIVATLGGRWVIPASVEFPTQSPREAGHTKQHGQSIDMTDEKARGGCDTTGRAGGGALQARVWVRGSGS